MLQVPTYDVPVLLESKISRSQVITRGHTGNKREQTGLMGRKAMIS